MQTPRCVFTINFDDPTVSKYIHLDFSGGPFRIVHKRKEHSFILECNIKHIFALDKQTLCYVDENDTAHIIKVDYDDSTMEEVHTIKDCESIEHDAINADVAFIRFYEEGMHEILFRYLYMLYRVNGEWHKKWISYRRCGWYSYHRGKNKEGSVAVICGLCPDESSRILEWDEQSNEPKVKFKDSENICGSILQLHDDKLIYSYDDKFIVVKEGKKIWSQQDELCLDSKYICEMFGLSYDPDEQMDYFVGVHHLKGSYSVSLYSVFGNQIERLDSLSFDAKEVSVFIVSDTRIIVKGEKDSEQVFWDVQIEAGKGFKGCERLCE